VAALMARTSTDSLGVAAHATPRLPPPTLAPLLRSVPTPLAPQLRFFVAVAEDVVRFLLIYFINCLITPPLPPHPPPPPDR
jgi:hypothetical protein